MLLLLLHQLQLYVEPPDLFHRAWQPRQADEISVVINCGEEIAEVLGVVGHQQVEEGGEFVGVDLVEVEGLGVDGGDVDWVLGGYVFDSHFIFGVDVVAVEGLDVVVVHGGDGEAAVDALAEAGHLGVVVPVEHLPLGHYHEEEGELGLDLYGQGDYRIWRYEVFKDVVEVGDS